jgi:hypothetical protein
MEINFGVRGRTPTMIKNGDTHLDYVDLLDNLNNFMGELEQGNLDDFTIMVKATELRKEIEAFLRRNS